MRFAFYTLGCKTNQYETQAMEQLLTELGHEIGQFDQPCDGYIINTCSVTAVADKKNRAVIRRCRRDNPDAVIGVCGCYSQHAPEAVRALGVDIIGGSGGRREFVELMLSAMEGKTRAEQLDNALRRREFEVLPAGGLEERTRAMLKVQDGCVNFCSYCIIPYTRGPIRSAPVDVAVSQAQELARRGYREIVVTGIEIASWGADLPGKPAVTKLIEAVCTAVPALRVRLGSLEPRIVTEDFCRRLSRLPMIILFPFICLFQPFYTFFKRLRTDRIPETEKHFVHGFLRGLLHIFQKRFLLLRLHRKGVNDLHKTRQQILRRFLFQLLHHHFRYLAILSMLQIS